MKTSPWIARLALAAVIGAALWGVFDPNFTGEEFRVGKDQVIHALCVYLFTLLAVPAFPRINPLIIGSSIFVLGLVLEYLQDRGIVPGAYQPSDLVADAVGVLAALLPLLLNSRFSKRR
jgi:hypothetical protein